MMIERLSPLTEEQVALGGSLDRIVAEVSPPERVQKLDEEKTFDKELHAALATAGILGVGTPVEKGGRGGGPQEQIIVLETLARKATSMGISFVVHFLIAGLLRDHATQEQREEYLAPFLQGRKFGSFCLTEAGGGTDILAAMRTEARRDEDGWLLSGSKTWISGATFSDFMLVLARTGEHRTRGITMFLVPSDAAGVSSTRIRSVAINGYPSCDVTFDDVRLPSDAVLGEVDMGFVQVLAALNSERLNAAAAVNGIARGALETAVDFAREREAFGRPIGQFQALQHRLVSVGISIESAWMLTLEAARCQTVGEPAEVISSMAKYASSKAAVAATDIGMEAMASAGFEIDRPMQRYYRDCRLHVIAPLNNDMILNFAAERWLGLPRSY